MATRKTADEVEVTTEDAAEPSAARKAFLAGEMTWNDYCAAENATESPAD